MVRAALIVICVLSSAATALSLSDPRAEAIADRVTRRYMPPLERCFARALARDVAEIGGRASLSFVVLPDGRTAEPRLTGASDAMTRCALAAVREWQFAPDTESTAVAFTLQLLPELASKSDASRVRRAIGRVHGSAIRDCLGREDPGDSSLELTLRRDGSVAQLETRPHLIRATDCLRRASQTWTFSGRPRTARIELSIAAVLPR